MSEFTSNLVKTYQGKKVLISGGVGFIGSNLALRLLEYGADITIFDSLTPQYGGNLENLKPYRDRLDVHISDVRDSQSLPALVRQKDFFFNLAAQTSHMDSMTDPFTDLEINAKGQLSLLECCRRENSKLRIIYASTRQIYGKPDSLPVDETHPLRPVDVNGINKLSGEQYHQVYQRVYGIPTTILRLTNTYGPRMRIKDARQTFIGIWIKQAMQDSAFEVWGGEQIRDFTYVSDCVDAFLLAAASDVTIGKVYNLGGEKAYTLAEVAQCLVDACGTGSFTVKEYPEERKKIDIGDFYSDYALIQSDIGWSPKISLESGLKETVHYYKERLGAYL